MQGAYITCFQEKISFLFPMIWEKTKNKQSPELMIKLLKIFKIWDMFFAKETLNQISETLKLDEEVSFSF